MHKWLQNESNDVKVQFKLIHVYSSGNGPSQVGTHSGRCLDAKMSACAIFPSCEGNRLTYTKSGKFIHEPDDLDKRTSYLEV
jgi:hypothetical protein